MIYLDNNATTPLDPRVLEEMMPYFKDHFGNPSSLHRLGLEAERAIKKARERIAAPLKAKPHELVFTSGATESINWGIRAAAKINKRKGKHIITSAIEHSAVLATCNALKEDGYQITYLKPDAYGKVFTSQVLEALQSDTVLVALMHVNNELGVIYPYEELGKKIKVQDPSILFFVDGAQGFGKMPVDLTSVDLYAMSGQKIHGPKGVGALYIKSGIHIQPLLYGGGQEHMLRSGTENVPAIVGFGKAAELAYANVEEKRAHIKKLHEALRKGIHGIDNTHINSPIDGIETTLNCAFLGIPGEVLLHQLEEENIFVSTGASCKSGKKNISHVLEALPISNAIKKSSIRVGLSYLNTMDEVEQSIEVFKRIVPQLRNVIPRDSRT